MKTSLHTSVLIADDHPIVREGLASILRQEPGLDLVAEVCSWPQTIEAITRHRPQLAILDLHMPGMEAADAIPKILEKSPDTRIVILTAFDGEEDVYQALRAGVKGYMPKETGKPALRECIHAVLDGNTWVHPSAASKLASRLQATDITPREMEILKFVATGKSNKEIGATLGITTGTVKVHASHVFAKLGVNGRVAATQLAIKRGIVPLP